MKNQYKFTFYTGYGYREISAHTIKGYDLNIKAENDKQAFELANKRRFKLLKYNDCYLNSKCSVFSNNKTGICFFDYNAIVWENSKLYWGSQVLPFYNLSSFILPTPKYKYMDNDWVANYICKSVYPSYTAYMQYVYKRQNCDSFGLTAEENIKKYYTDQIKSLLKNKTVTKEEKEELSLLTI